MAEFLCQFSSLTIKVFWLYTFMEILRKLGFF